MNEQEMAEERIKAAHGPSDKGWQERYEHIREAHRQQALRHVELETQLGEQRKLIREKNEVLRGLRATLKALEENEDHRLAMERQAHDELYRQHVKVGGVLSLLVHQLHDGEATFDKVDKHIGSRIIEDGDAIHVRAIDLTPATPETPEEDEPDED